MTQPQRSITSEHAADILHGRLLETLDEIDNLDVLIRETPADASVSDVALAIRVQRLHRLREGARDRLKEILRLATDRWLAIAERNADIIRNDFARWSHLRAWRGAGVHLYQVRTPIWLGGAASWGLCYWSRDPSRRVMDVACSYDLAETRTTLLHEMAHAAVWYFGGLSRRRRNETHGSVWREVYAEACAEVTGCYPIGGAAGIDQDVVELMRDYMPGVWTCTSVTVLDQVWAA